jgi:Zn-dependent M28 family amino/carboxypeptidase
MATRYAYEQFAEFGLAVTYHNYTRDGHQLRNVVAEKSGLTHPEDTYLVTAHIDDLPEGDSAPGADDNGSGSVAVLAAAQTLASHPFAHTIRFVLFTGEEQGLLGSDAYAADCAARGESIHGVVNLDMIGYNTGEPAFNLYARSGTYPGASGSRQLAEVFSNVVELYNLNLAPHRIHNDTYPLRWGSDQWSFLNRGYPAILVIEDYAGYDFTPYYHTSNDRLDTLDLAFFRDLTRAAIATIAHLGHLLSSDSLGQLSGTVYEIGTARPLSGATVAASCSTGYYTFTTLTDASGLYSLSLPPKAYTLTTRTAAPGHYVSIVSNVVVITNHLTIQDIALDPWLRWYLPRIPYDP